ncbi:MAG TPA: TlpA disulfide reductase family protein [Chitinophagaceae bacterium]|jgi:peroxiredoxin|nr:TlpA disulfide reductase family protein [Chitinophagaceae bacterium]
MRVLRVHLVLLVAVVFIMASCKEEKKSPSNFKVSGAVTNSHASTIYLEKIPIGMREGEGVDSAKLDKDGKYSLSAFGEESMVFNLRLDESKMPIASVVNDNPNIELNIELANGTANPLATKYEVKNSAGSESIRKFIIDFNNKLRELNELSRQGDSMRAANVPDSAYNPLRAAYRKTTMEIKDYTRELVDANATVNPAVALYFLAYYQEIAYNPQVGLPGFSRKEVNTIIKEVAASFPAHKRLDEIHQSIVKAESDDKARAANSAWIGKQAEEIALPDVNGKIVKLSSYRGKYVLVDFWASWCGPCRQENPNVVATFEKFKNKNFTIIGVSLDDNKDNWLKAIRQDQLNWTHISDLKRWSSVVVDQYKFGETGIPYNLLIDPNGKIIGERLMGEELESKLSEVLN